MMRCRSCNNYLVAQAQPDLLPGSLPVRWVLYTTGEPCCDNPEPYLNLFDESDRQLIARANTATVDEFPEENIVPTLIQVANRRLLVLAMSRLAVDCPEYKDDVCEFISYLDDLGASTNDIIYEYSAAYLEYSKGKSAFPDDDSSKPRRIRA